MKKSMIAIITALLLLLSVAPATALADTAESNSNLTIDTLTATIGGEPQTLDPAFADRVDSANYILHMLEGLTTIDRSGKVVPGIAESWTISSDGTVYTFHLRDAKWSDGQAVTAADFVYAWRRIIDPVTKSSTAYNMMFVKNAAKIQNKELPASDLGVEAVDASTLQVTLEAPCGFFLQVVGNTAYMPARSDMVSDHSDDWTQSAGTYPSDGPYMLQSWVHDSQIVMVKNPDYWNISNITGPNRIVWKLMSVDDPDAVRAAYEENELQYASGVPAELYDSKDLRVFPSLGTYYLDFNNTKAPFNDVRVRQAINLVIDRSHIVDLIGGNEPANNFVPKGITQPDDTDFNKEATPAYSIDPSEYDNNVTQAKELLASAGYSETNPFPTIEYITNNGQGHEAIAACIQLALKEKLGINMNIQAMEWNEFTAARSAGNFDIAREGWLADYGDPYSFLQLFISNNEGNRANYSNAAYDDLLNQANTETDMTERFALMQQAQYQLMHEDHAVCPIYYYTQHAAAKPKLNSITNVYSGFTFFFWTVQGRIDTLTATIGPEPQSSLDPVFNSDQVGANYILHMLEGLTTIDQSGKVVPGIAENWEISSDGTVYTFHLRDAKWSDGQAVTANDFVYAWQRVANPENYSAYSYLMEFLKNGKAIINRELPISELGVVAINNKTLEVTLESPYCSFLELTGSAAFVPVRSDIVAAHPDDWANSADTYLANGPYKMQSWEHNSEIVMAKNPNYWNIADITGPGRIVWKLMNDADAIHTAYEANELQYAKGVSAALYDSVDLKEYPTLGTNYLNFNCKKEPFNDVRVRKAINLVIDRNYIKGLIGGNEPADNFVPKGFSQPDGTDFNEEATPPYSISPYDYESNVIQAKQLLADAGYPNGEDFPQIVYGTNNESNSLVATADYIKKVLSEKLGIDMVIQSMDWGSFQIERSKGNFDIARIGWVVDYYDLYNFLQIFKSDNSINKAYYSNPAYDSLLEQSNAATDMAERFQKLQQAQNMLMNQDYAICPIFHYTQWAAAKPNLSGIVNAYAGYTFFFWTVQIPESESLTKEGSDVQINNDQASTTITFDNVTESGFTYPKVLGNPPVGTYFHLRDSVGYLDISSTAAFTGGVTITVSFDPSEISGSESDLRLYQYKDGRPIDITQSVDTENNTITGVVTDDFCPFAIGIPATYQVTFNTQDGSDVINRSVSNGALIDAPQTPTRRGYTFGGWYKEPEYKNAWDFASDRMPERDITLYAKWTVNQYTVIFSSQGGTAVGDIMADYGSKIIAPVAPTKTGYTFSGWYKEAACTTPWIYDTDTIPDHDIVLYAKWTIHRFTITFNSQGGIAVGDINADYGSKITAPTAPTRTGYNFGGWYKEAACTNAWLFSTDTIPAHDIILFAKWTINEYTVSFDSQGGSVVGNIKANYDTKITAPNAPTRIGYTFGGWYKEAAYTNAWEFATDTIPAHDIILFAKWTINEYTVSFDSQGGSAVGDIGAYYDSSITAPVAPARTGYTFGGWYKEAACTTAWVFNTDTVPDHDITLYARWMPITPAKPTNVKAVSDSYNGIKVSWDTLSGVSGYEIYRSTSSSGTYTYVTAATGTSYTNTGLTTNTVYYYKVRAYYDASSRIYSAWSVIVFARPVPATPASFIVSSASFNSIKVSWGAVAGATRYDIYRATTSGGTYKLLTATSALYYINTNLTTGSAYYYKVKAYRLVGTTKVYGAFTTYAGARPTLSTPASVKATAASYNMVTVTWGAVTGASGYELYRTSSTDSTERLVITTTALSYTNVSLSTGTTYNYKVRAYRLVGSTKVYGSFSAVSSATPTLAAPPSVTAMEVSNTSIKISWGAVSGATKYEVWSTDSEGAVDTLLAETTSLSYIHSGVTTGTGISYSYIVKAYRLVGIDKVYSNPSYSRWTFVPSSVAAASASYNSASINWAAVRDAVGYEVYRATSSTGTYSKVATTAETSYANTGLTTGSTYYYKVRTYKIVDTATVYGDFTAVVSARPVPAVPATLIVSSASYSSIKVSWGAVNGASRYEIYRATSSTGTYTLLTSTTALSYINTGLLTSTAYYYKVRAYHMEGTAKVYGAFTAYVYTRPALAVPTSVRTTQASYSSIKVTWGAVTGASRYELYRTSSADSTERLVIATTALAYTNVSLSTGTTYNYKVRAYRLVSGRKVYGAFSTISSCTPTLPVPPTVKAARVSATSITVSWGAVSGTTKYEVWSVDSVAGTESLLAETTALNYTDTSLSTGVGYSYKVRAYRLVGSIKVYSDFSAVVTATP